MEKLMNLVEISPLKENQTKDRDGQPITIESFEVIFSDGIDTVLGETGKNLTAQFKREAPELNAIYNVRTNLSLVEYEKEGQKRRFFKCVILDAVKL